MDIEADLTILRNAKIDQMYSYEFQHYHWQEIQLLPQYHTCRLAALRPLDALLPAIREVWADELSSVEQHVCGMESRKLYCVPWAEIKDDKRTSPDFLDTSIERFWYDDKSDSYKVKLLSNASADLGYDSDTFTVIAIDFGLCAEMSIQYIPGLRYWSIYRLKIQYDAWDDCVDTLHNHGFITEETYQKAKVS